MNRSLKRLVEQRTETLLKQTDDLRKEIEWRKQAEESLQESETRLRTIFDVSQAGIILVDPQGAIVYANKGMAKMFKCTQQELIGSSYPEHVHPDQRDMGDQRMRQLITGEIESIAIERHYIRKDGTDFWGFLSGRRHEDNQGKIISLVAIIADITELKTLENELRQAKKMEAVGNLAGGIAHDFNNLLMGIQGRSSLMSLDMDPSHPHREHILAIEEYIRSATRLTQQLLGFARGGKYEVKAIDMNELLLGSSAMFGRTRKEIRIHTKCAKSPLVVEADRGQIEQVLLNMYVNAWQAMPPEGGDLYLETKIVTLDEAYCKIHRVKPGPYVKVSITDTGAGMDEATRLRIFDPFFTTKAMRRGTGLGLSSAYGIIKNHGGMITVYSEIGNGTIFNIHLPVSDQEAHQEISQEGELVKGLGTILLVDDEELIIDVGQAMLEGLGYSVVACKGGQEAVRAIMDMGDKIDMVILDLIMPGMDGEKTFDLIRDIRPQMPVILSSGYAINGKATEIMQRGCNGFIQKPYNLSELSRKIIKVLDESK